MDDKKHSGDPLDLSKEDLEAIFESTFREAVEGPPKKDQNKATNTPLSEGSVEASENKNLKASRNKILKPDGASKPIKSSLRMKYEAEVESIKKTHGDLEVIRRKLGLSKRKVAQLLLVDPSAWTRWTTKTGEAPPHIYRALQWFLLLQDKHPEYKSSLWLNAVATPSLSDHEIENIKQEVIAQARSQMDQMPTYIETESVDLGPIERRLKRSQTQVKNLGTNLKWLIISQTILVIGLILVMIF